MDIQQEQGVQETTTPLQPGPGVNIMSQINGYKNAAYSNTMAAVNEISMKLQSWSDASKGKDKNPDNYLPVKHFKLIYQLDKASPQLVMTLADLGRQLRSASPTERDKIIETHSTQL